MEDDVPLICWSMVAGFGLGLYLLFKLGLLCASCA